MYVCVCECMRACVRVRVCHFHIFALEVWSNTKIKLANYFCKST